MFQLTEELRSKTHYMLDAWQKSAEKLNDAAIKWRDAGDNLKDTAREIKGAAQKTQEVVEAALLVVGNVHGFAITGAVNEFAAYWTQKRKIELREWQDKNPGREL